MHFVDDVHALFRARRAEDGLVTQRTDVVHAVVGGGVQFHHVHDSAVVDAAAGGALVAGVAVDRVLTVDSFGQNLGAGGLAGAAGTDEQIGVAELIVLHLIFQGLCDMLLAHHVVERPWAVFTV